MKVYRQIASVFLLCAYSIVLLHTMIPHCHIEIPHCHIEKESVEALISDHSSDHHHTHSHHHHSENSESNWFETLLEFLGDFDHNDLGGGHFQNYVSQNQYNFDLSSKNVFKATMIVANILLDYNPSIENNRDIIYPSPTLFEQYFSCSIPLRGPPFIS